MRPLFRLERTVPSTYSPATPRTWSSVSTGTLRRQAGPLVFLRLWPPGQARPTVSTLNAPDGAVTSNLAIVPTTNGSISAFASNLTHMIIDIRSEEHTSELQS